MRGYEIGMLIPKLTAGRAYSNHRGPDHLSLSLGLPAEQAAKAAR